MAFILSIETATKNCSVSLSNNGKTVSCKEIAEQNFSHAEKLHVFIQEILKENSITLNDLSAIAVSKGPGSYTGLRIGVSSVKGLCYALNIPMIDARRMEVYTAFFDKKYNIQREVRADIIDENSYSEINANVHLVGDGIAKFKEVLTNNKFIFHDSVIYPSANEMSAIAFEKYKKSDFVDVAYFEPYYLKDFVLNK